MVLVGAGSGARLGAEIPKAFCKIREQSLLSLSASAAALIPNVTGLVCVVPAGWEAQAKTELEGIPLTVPLSVPLFITAGGETRHQSVVQGIARLDAEFSLQSSDIIAIHDAARCLVTGEIFQQCVLAAQVSGAASAAAPIRDTVKCIRDSLVTSGSSVSRDGLYGMQTPQAFRYDVLKAGMLSEQALEATDEVSLVQTICPVTIVETPFWNFKVTYSEDLEMADAILQARNVTSAKSPTH